MKHPVINEKEKIKLRVIQILCIVSLLITIFSIQRTYARYFEKIDTTYATKIKRWVINVNNSNIRENETLSEVMVPEFIENEHMNNNDTLVPGREGYFPFEIDYSSVDLTFQFAFNLEQLNTTQLEDFEIYGFQIIDGENTNTVEILDWSKVDSEIDPITKINPIIDPITGSIKFEKVVKKEDNTLEQTEVVQELNDDKKVEVRVLFRWNDENADTEDEADVAGMNNLEDTQYVGEENPPEGSQQQGGGGNTTDGIHKFLNYNIAITFTQYLEPNQEQP